MSPLVAAAWLVAWCAVAVAVGLLVGRTVRIRDGQIPHA